MKLFVRDDSIVRKIWGKADTVLFIFAGASAEFALNKAVDWLYYTGRLPADPLGRLFSTVSYSQRIIFSTHDEAVKAINAITAIHRGVEASRGAQIPDWAYRDVLFMLIDYSISSFEVLERKLTLAEKEEVFDVFYRVGTGMQLVGLPASFSEWETMRRQHLQDNMQNSLLTVDLYKQYRKHLGKVRYAVLKYVQVLVTPNAVRKMLRLSTAARLLPILFFFKLSRIFKMDKRLKGSLLPDKYKAQIMGLDVTD